MGDNPQHRDEQYEMARLRIPHALVEVSQVLGGPFGGQVEVRVEHRQRAAAQQPLGQYDPDALVQPSVPLDVWRSW